MLIGAVTKYFIHANFGPVPVGTNISAIFGPRGRNILIVVGPGLISVRPVCMHIDKLANIRT